MPAAFLLSIPGRRRGQLLRRGLAVALLGAAVISALSSARGNPTVVVAARDIPAGHEIADEDLTTARVPAHLVPPGSGELTAKDLAGRVTVAAVGTGEILTQSRVLSTQLVADFAQPETGGGGAASPGPGAAAPAEMHLIPVKLAEPDVLPHLHHGDTVNVIAGNVTAGNVIAGNVIAGTSAPGAELGIDGAPSHTTIAIGGRVVSVSGAQEDARPDTVLLALPAEDAEAVAAASLAQPLTVVIVGDRAHPSSQHAGS